MSTSHGHNDEEELARLISALPPAPSEWTTAAKELPMAKRAIDQILAHAAHDDHFRVTTLNHPEDALREAGCEPAPALVSALRKRLVDTAIQGGEVSES